MVVLVIIGIITALAVPIYNANVAAAKAKQAATNVEEVTAKVKYGSEIAEEKIKEKADDLSIDGLLNKAKKKVAEISDDIDQYKQDNIEVIVVDGCQYIKFNGELTHKANCPNHATDLAEETKEDTVVKKEDDWLDW